MDPQVEAAWIGAGVAAVGILSGALIAIISSANSRRTNAATLAAATAENIRTLDAARDDRRWDQKASAYVDAIRVINYRQDKRLAELSTIRPPLTVSPDDAGPDVRELEARLIAFAPTPVQEVFRAAIKADVAARSAWEAWQEMADQERQNNQTRAATGVPLPALPGATALAAKASADEAAGQTAACDNAAIAAIRADLGRRASEDGSDQSGSSIRRTRPAWSALIPQDPTPALAGRAS